MFLDFKNYKKVTKLIIKMIFIQRKKGIQIVNKIKKNKIFIISQLYKTKQKMIIIKNKNNQIRFNSTTKF